MTKTQTGTEAKYVSRQHAAKALAVSMRSIKRYMDSGKLAYKRDVQGGRVWITAESLQRAVEARPTK